MANLAPPAPMAMLNETMTWIEFPKLVMQSGQLLNRTTEHPRQVLVFPGFGAGNASTALLRGYLARIGHTATGWPMGTNEGEVEALIFELRDWALREHERRGTLTLVGWSLGGYLAREVAREVPEIVDQVITMGSPVKGGPKYTQIASVYQQRGYNLDEIEQAVIEREAVLLQVPVTALYSRRDGVVAWQACIDDVSDGVTHIEVETTHTGFGFSPDVFRIIADKLG